MTKEELLELYKKLKTQKALREYLNISEGKLVLLLAENGININKKRINKAAETFIQKAKKVHGEAFDYSETKYERSCLKVKIKCNTCGKSFIQKANNHLNGQGCPYCKSKISSKRQMKAPANFLAEVKAIFGDKYDYTAAEYKGAKTKIKIFCNKCQRFFYKTPDKHLYARQGCPYCGKNSSHGENEVAEWLIQNNIHFIQQKRFADCKDIRSLPFDFYLPDYNICIEYQGRQHYFKENRSKFHKTISDWLYTKKHDRIKKEYCLKNNIAFIEICFNKSTNQQLETILLPLLYNINQKKGN